MNTPRSRFLSLPLIAALALALLAWVTPASASTGPYCGITWGSLAKTSGGAAPATGATVRNVRAGQHACYDRLVVDIAGTPTFASWRVQYVSGVTADASGRPVPLRGGAYLQITVGAADHTFAGTATYPPSNRTELVNVSGYRTFRQAAWAGSFEGLTSIGLGVRARLPFRVLAVTGIPGSASGTRVVIDVAHAW